MSLNSRFMTSVMVLATLSNGAYDISPHLCHNVLKVNATTFIEVLGTAEDFRFQCVAISVLGGHLFFLKDPLD